MSHPLDTMNLNGFSRRVLTGLLESAVAVQGKRTTVPVLVALSFADGDEETLRDTLEDLITCPRTVQIGKGWSSFAVVLEVEWLDEANLLSYQLNPEFLKWYLHCRDNQ